MSTDDDLFDDAKSAYITVDDLVGRLILVWAEGIRKDLPGTNGTYDAIEARYIILDGDPMELAPSIPHVVPDGLFSAGQFVNKLKHRVGNPKPVLGRVDARPSKANKKVMAYGLAEPTDADKAVARKYLTENPPEDPFNA